MKAAILLLACLGFATGAAGQQALVFTTESYPPYAYQEPSGNYRGAGIDQVEIIMQNVGVPHTMEMMPWARAIALAETRPMHCVFAAARTPEREATFKWVVPLLVDRNILVRHSGSNASASTLDEAKRYTIGTHRQDYTETLLRNLGFPEVDISADVDTTLRKLLGDRIDMMPISEAVYERLRADGTRIEKVIIFSEQRLGIACHKDVPDDLINRMQANLDRLIKDGVQDAILQRYGVKLPQ